MPQPFDILRFAASLRISAAGVGGGKRATYEPLQGHGAPEPVGLRSGRLPTDYFLPLV